MAYTSFKMICTCKDDGLADFVRSNSPSLQECIWSIIEDFLDGGIVEIAADMWFGIFARGKEINYTIMCDEVEIGIRQLWRLLVAQEGWETFVARSAFAWDTVYDLDRHCLEEYAQ